MEMIVWEGMTGTYLTPGEGTIRQRFLDRTATTDAPYGRSLHAAVWTARNDCLGWWVYDGSVHCLNSGGRYKSGNGFWVPTSTPTLLPPECLPRTGPVRK